MFTLRIFILLLAAAALRAEVQQPTPYDATYDISKGVFKLGTMARRLHIRAGGEYVFESTMETRGLVSLFARDRVVETSRGKLDGMRFIPEHYAYVKSAGERDYSLFFDYTSGVVRRDDRAGAWSAKMPVNLLDKLVYQAQLMLDLGDAPRTLTYNIAAKSKLKEYVIENLGNEHIDTDAGRFETIKLERSKADSKRRTTVWCARELGWIPVKVEHVDKKGGLTTALLRSVKHRF